jgi:Fe-S cluster assembly protein SufD
MNTMIDIQEEKNVYLSNFAQLEKELGGATSAPIHRIRKAAMRRFTELGFPGPRDEDWKFTNLAPLAKLPFKLAGSQEKAGVSLSVLEEAAFAVGSGHRVVLVDGRYSPELSSIKGLPRGVQISSLAARILEQSARLEAYLAKYAPYQSHAFTALNTAFMRDGAFIDLPAGTVVEEPICVFYVSTAAAEGCVTHPRSLILAGANSQLRIVESYIGVDSDVYFTNAVTEVVADADARVDHYKLQRESLEAFHVGTLQVEMERGSKFSSHYLGFGGSLVRHEVRAHLAAEGCECTLNGLYAGSGRQHMDNHTVIDHAMPRCASHELYKGILDGKAHGVFNGKIFVHQDAQKTDAKQTNQTLLLSDDAVINTKPQLEIYADDVKCTHGATVGQLDPESIFYLRSRGIGLAEARALLTFAFANDIVGRVQVEPLRHKLEEQLLARHQLPSAEAAS